MAYRWPRLAGIVAIPLGLFFYLFGLAGIFALIVGVLAANVQTIVLSIPFLMIGGIPAYITSALLFNKTNILIKDDEIRVRHLPLPWPGSLRCPRSQFGRLYIKESSDSRGNLYAIYSQSADRPILRKIRSKRVAYSYLGVIEEYLAIDKKN